MIDRNFLKKVIDEAAKTYVTGNSIAKTLRDQISAGKKQDESGREYTVQGVSGANYPRVVQEAYPDTNASTIPESLYIAAEGPQKRSVEKFIEILLNETYPIRHVIALGACLAYEDRTYQDFLDYCIVPSIEKPRDFGKYTVIIPQPQGQFIRTIHGDQVTPMSVINTTLVITTPEQKEIKVQVTIVPLRDNQSITIDTDNPVGEKPHYATALPTFQQMWHLFKETSKQRTLVHCTSGVGRTGHIILTFEILKHYLFIFNDPDPKICAQRIHDILSRMRCNRPCLVNMQEQFVDAIANAAALYDYAVLNKLELDEYILPVDNKEILSPAPSSNGVTVGESPWYVKQFASFSNNPDGSKIPRRGAVELKLFYDELALTKSVGEIQELLRVAKPYINRHMYPRFDSVFRKAFTRRWDACIVAARTRGLELLHGVVKTAPGEAVSYLQGVRDISLFSLHRHRRKSSAGSLTHAQIQIDEMIKSVRPGK